MIKYILSFLTAVIFTTAIDAQIDAKSKEILAKASAKNKSYTSITAKFQIIIENSQANSKEKHDGSIDIKGDKYHIKMVNNESFFDGKTVWTLMTEANEVNISEPDPSDENVVNPAKVFTMYEKGFKAQFIGETTIGTKKVSEIHLFPEAHDKPYSRIKLFVDNETSNIVRVAQVGKDGNIMTIEMSSFEVNKPLSDSLFTFDATKYPNVDVIDLR